MEITFRDAVTVLHGMGFGAVLLLFFSGAGMVIYALSLSSSPWRPTASEQRLISGYFATMALLAWIAVLVGAYVVYPWYRAHQPPGTVDLSGFPQRLLMSSPTTTGWHDIGMEWKEHIAWFAPISLTAVAFIVARYGAQIRTLNLRTPLIALLALAFTATGVAGFFGAMLNKYAPVRGGADIVLMKGEGHE
jgi:hypothetical protein